MSSSAKNKYTTDFYPIDWASKKGLLMGFNFIKSTSRSKRSSIDIKKFENETEFSVVKSCESIDSMRYATVFQIVPLGNGKYLSYFNEGALYVDTFNFITSDYNAFALSCMLLDEKDLGITSSTNEPTSNAIDGLEFFPNPVTESLTIRFATPYRGSISISDISGRTVMVRDVTTIFVVAYSLVMDAYCEKREKKITYLIWWLMMFSGFLAISLFNFGLKKNIRTRSQFMQDYYHQPSDETLRRMNQLSDSLIAGDVFSRIASLDAPSRFEQHDLHQYIFGTDSLNHSYAVELFDKRTGSTLFNNHFADFHKLNQTYLNSSRIAKNLVHNPFENSYLLRFEIARSVPVNTSWYLFIVRPGAGDIFRGSRACSQGFWICCIQREQTDRKEGWFARFAGSGGHSGCSQKQHQ